ncbi:hypothetical protein GQ457_17G014720 [Hibiscus cannabinus]
MYAEAYLNESFNNKATIHRTRLRFPFLFSKPTNPPGSDTSQNIHRTTSQGRFSALFAVVAAAAGVAVVSQNPNHPFFKNVANLLLPNSFFGARSPLLMVQLLSSNQRAGFVFLRFWEIPFDFLELGVYTNGDDLKKFLSNKYDNLSASELKDNKDLKNDLMEADISMTIRLQIVYGKLSIQSIRNAYKSQLEADSKSLVVQIR